MRGIRTGNEWPTLFIPSNCHFQLYKIDIHDINSHVLFINSQETETRLTKEGVETKSVHQAKVVQTSTVSSSVMTGELPLPLAFTDAIKHGMLNTKTGMFKDPRNGKELTVDGAIKQGVLNGESATFKEKPTPGIVRRTYLIKEAIERHILEVTGEEDNEA